MPPEGADSAFLPTGLLTLWPLLALSLPASRTPDLKAAALPAAGASPAVKCPEHCGRNHAQHCEHMCCGCSFCLGCPEGVS